MPIENIKKAACEFRQSIEVCGASLGAAFEHFPSGCCGDATPLLGTYLIERGLGEFQYMLGYYKYSSNDSCSHAWLQSDSLIIDITADQFSDISEKVIVARKSKWHELLKGAPQNLADYRIYDSNTVATLSVMYQEIVKNIK